MIMMISTMVWIKFNFQEKKQSDWRKDRVALETYIVFQKVLMDSSGRNFEIDSGKSELINLISNSISSSN